jgi:hypothetical protein
MSATVARARAGTWMDADTLCHGFADLGLEARCLLGPGSEPDADVLEVDKRPREGHGARAGGQPTAVRVRTDHLLRPGVRRHPRHTTGR